MSYFHYSPPQASRSNIGVTPRQSVQNISYGNRMQPTPNNLLHPSQSNQQSSVYGRNTAAPSIQSVGSSQYLQGRQPQYGRSQIGRSSSSSKGYSGSQAQPSQGQQLLPGGPDGVKYIPLNWEDLLGGKEGMKGLQVSMAPSGDPGSPNRQLKFSFGSPGQGDAPANPGEVPLKVVSFQPVEDYPGKGGKPITMNSQQMMQPITMNPQQRMLPPRNSSAYQPQQGQPQYQQMSQSQSQQALRSSAMMAAGPNNPMPGQPQMIMMPPVYYTPGKGIISAPPGMQMQMQGQGQNSCKGCPNCKGNTTNSMPNNQRY